VDIDDDTILAIQKIYETDIRSTINFIQLNRALKQEEWKFKILNDEVFQYIHSLMLNYDAEKDADNRSMDTIIEVMHNTLVRYNIDNFTFIQKYFKYIIKNHTDLVTDEFLTVVSNVIHDSSNINTTDLNRYVIHNLSKLFSKYKIELFNLLPLYKYNIMTTMLKNTSERNQANLKN
jgi:hypothetical protein